MGVGKKATDLLGGIVPVAVCLALAAGLFVPVYTDEVGWRLQERAGFDGVDKLFVQLCGPSTIARPPFWMMPMRYYSAFFNGHFADPFYVRLSGVLYALTWVGMLVLLVRRLVPNGTERALLRTTAFGLVGIGLMPLLLVWSRPEQPILLALTGAILIALHDGPRGAPPISASGAWARSLAIAALWLVALSYHLKASFLLAAFLACLLAVGRGRSAFVPRLVAAGIILSATAQGASYWVHRLECPGNAAVRAMFGKLSAGVDLLGARNLHEFAVAVGEVLSNLNAAEYLLLLVPHTRPMSAWLEFGQVTPAAQAGWVAAIGFLWLLTLVLAGAPLLSEVRGALREKRFVPRIPIAAGLTITILGWSAVQSVRNAYEASFAVAMMILVVLIGLAGVAAGNPNKSAWQLRVLAAIVGTGSLISITLVTQTYGPSLARAASQSGYIVAQPHSIGVFGYPDVERRVLSVGRQCRLGDPARARRLLIDDLTYFAYMRSALPDHKDGLWGADFTHEDPMSYLRQQKAGGMIVGCRYLPPEIRAQTKGDGTFCCLGPVGH